MCPSARFTELRIRDNRDRERDHSERGSSSRGSLNVGGTDDLHIVEGTVGSSIGMSNAKKTHIGSGKSEQRGVEESQSTR
jgi:hypothetical protein